MASCATPSDEGRSKVVSRDVRAMVKKVLPAVIRTIMGNDQVVEYKPGGKGMRSRLGRRRTTSIMSSCPSKGLRRDPRCGSRRAAAPKQHPQGMV